jgi:hypothetical protein
MSIFSRIDVSSQQSSRPPGDAPVTAVSDVSLLPCPDAMPAQQFG